MMRSVLTLAALLSGACTALPAATREAPDSTGAALTVLTDPESSLVRVADSLEARAPARFLLPASGSYDVTARGVPADRWDAPSARARVLLLRGREDTLRMTLESPSLALRADGPSQAEALGMSGAVVSEVHSPDPPPLHLYVTGGVIVVAGAVSAVTKIAADDAYSAFLLSGDGSQLDRTRRLDRTAAVSLVITQISFALFTYFLLAD
jgi:hypothetical protein